MWHINCFAWIYGVICLANVLLKSILTSAQRFGPALVNACVGSALAVLARDRTWGVHHAGMGLLSQPAHCQISMPASESGLLRVTMEDIRAVPLSLDPQVHCFLSCLHQ
jgi:hypothetical protein